MVAIQPSTAKSAVSQRILSETAVLKMILLEPNKCNHVILHTLYAAGLRFSELCDLRWRNVIRTEQGVQLDIRRGKARILTKIAHSIVKPLLKRLHEAEKRT